MPEPLAAPAGVDTPIGWIWVAACDRGITRVWLARDRAPAAGAVHPLAQEACRALAVWLHGGAWPRHLPLAPAGTPFRQRVWRALRTIPPGQTSTYGELAHRLGTSARAVGGACRANPVPLLVPCHRVVARQGTGGFAGATRGPWPALKRWLLDHER